jgi:signal transduction histidine kinase
MSRANETGIVRSPGSVYLITGVMLSVLVWIVSYNFAVTKEEGRFNDAEAQAHQIAVFFERHVVGIFQYGDAYLKLVRREYVQHYDLAKIEQLMAEVPLNNSIASHITIIDENGIPLMVSGHEIKAGTTARDRDYFKFQKQAKGDDLLVSKMHMGRNSGKLIVRLVRRFEKPGGGFGGVMFLALEASHITDFFNTMQMGPQSSATLVGKDKFVRSRSSYGPRGPGQDISGSQIWKRLEESSTGQYLQTSVVDNVTRHYAYREVPGFPLIVAIGLSVEDFKVSNAAARLNIYSIALLATLLIAGTTFFFYRQRQLLTQIEAKNIELEQRADEIEQKNIELQNQNAELERFNYTVSHDLKAPLVTIKGFLGLLQKDINAQDPEAIERDASQIGDAADKMGQLLEELLELSRIGRQMNPPENLDLNQLVQEALERVAMQIKNQNVEVRVAPDMPAVVGDPGRLLEVFQNLIDNSIKFMGTQQAPSIEIGAHRKNGEVHCFVRDNGIGIVSEYQGRVFDLFERLDARVEGTGVGLALIKRIVEVHGGRVWIESEGEGRGATFWFTLPDDSIDSAA